MVSIVLQEGQQLGLDECSSETRSARLHEGDRAKLAFISFEMEISLPTVRIAWLGYDRLMLCYRVKKRGDLFRGEIDVWTDEP
jgi:hypothetical protein